jgi:hypothetical protein
LTTRRTVITAAVGLAATAGIAPLGLAAASTPARAVPKTLARNGSPRHGSVRVDAAPFPLSHLGIKWTGTGTPGVRPRYATGWGDWQAVHGCAGGKDGALPGRAALLALPGAVGYEVASQGDTGDVAVTEINTVDGPATVVPAPAASAFETGGRRVPVRYFSRAAWGADESLRFQPDGTETWPPAYFSVQTLTVHHTGFVSPEPTPAATVRAIYYFDTITQEFGDFGYHLLVDADGNVYEGRYSGADPVPVFGGTPRPHGRPQMVNAAHVAGFNAGNVGVVLLGDFDLVAATRAARTSLTLVLAVLAAATGLDPSGTTGYVNPISGATATVRTISGHRDWAPTDCPGNLFYPELASVRRDVARLLGRSAG